MVLFEEDEDGFEDEFDEEANKKAKAFVVYGDLYDSNDVHALLNELGVSDNHHVTDDEFAGVIKTRDGYSIEFSRLPAEPYTWIFKSHDAKREQFKSFSNTLTSSQKIHSAWLPHKHLEEAKQDLSDKYTFNQVGFSLKYYPQIGIDHFTKITLMVYSKDSETYHKLLKKMFSDELGVYLKDFSSKVRITSLNPTKTGNVYLNDDFGISLVSGNTYDIFDDVSAWGRNEGWKLLNSASEYSWYRVITKEPDLKERTKKRSLSLSLGEIESKDLYNLTGVNDIKTLFTQYFTPTKEKESVRFPGRGRNFVAPSIEEYKNQTILRLLNFRKGETVVMSIDEKDLQLEIYPTNLTKPWTIINLCKEINEVYPANVEGFP